MLEDLLKQRADQPAAYISLAQAYADAERGPQAVKVLQDAEAKFPADTSILFELGAVFDKQKKFAEAETTFRQLLTREPDNAPVLNYLGYMLAERGERLDESVTLLKKALEKEPDNGSYLDSLGWAYFKADKLDLAETNLRRAADQLKANSVIQDHYGDVLFKLGPLRRGDCGLDARPRRRRRLDRARGDRQEDPRREAKTRKEVKRAPSPALAVAAALACASCGAPPLMKLPAGPGAPAADAADVLFQATTACRAVRTLTAEIAVSGSVAGHRIRGRLLAGVSAPPRRASPTRRRWPRSALPSSSSSPPATTRRCCCRATSACSSTGAPTRCWKRSPACRSAPRISMRR